MPRVNLRLPITQGHRTFRATRDPGFTSIKVQSLDANQIICRKGSQPEAWTHIVADLVSAGIPDNNGVITPINIFGPGTWFGEIAILNRQALMLECICLTPVRILTMPLAQAVEAFESEAEFSRYIARLVAWRTQQHAEMLTLMRPWAVRNCAWSWGWPCLPKRCTTAIHICPPTASTTTSKFRSNSPCWLPCAASRAAYFLNACSNSRPQAGCV
ncbi:MAG: Crp/Fnr family transcriptional regulator [Rhodoferax sp.]|uniref:Crp/Fnr family transcriptional regulator n=1 Tax=Rhodoferax sp. TaxID=50421 RepID=UPI003BB52B31